ncbi:MAG: tRNA (5-methylaminomethyl-2-thiouridine)(34)-methyltransferase MnmD [Alphaproteobacteria bacterium]|nr:tRNA (5-methylaminomethyl-2-thiouridine)(34)-methyltransferase MnmD [Alphaproteobacteria bacterium]
MSTVPRSEQFDDVYFSVEDGLAETRHVFLAGNGLPDAWAGREQFTICETGFGTGLNFLAAWKLWRDCDAALRPQSLHFISFEKYPVTRDFIGEVLGGWDGDLEYERNVLIFKYPLDLSFGTHRIEIFSNVFLTLVFGDVNDALPKLEERVDCWFLDGFKPSSNPDMWSEILFKNMARLSAPEATFATFTSAGFVRRGLAAEGFEVRKIRGYGRKREMSVGRFRGALM